MYKLCKTEQSAQRQRLLEQALLEAMAERPYDSISISDLCTQAGVPRKAFYRYFSGKEGALYSLIDHTLLGFEAYSSSANPDVERPWQESLEIFFRFWLDQRILLEALVKNDMSQMVVIQSVKFALSSQGVPQKFRRWQNMDIEEKAIQFILSGLMALVIAWCRAGFPESSGEMAAIAARLLTEPLFRI